MTNSYPELLADQVRHQIEALTIDPARPLIISDADEVLLQFIVGLEGFLDRRGLWLDLQSFALSGNVKDKETGAPVPASNMPALLDDFFATDLHTLDAVPDAASSLDALSARAQILVLSNVPFEHRESRAASLAEHGMDYPVIANVGLKGAAVRHLAAHIEAPVFFLDDIPHNIASVARAHAPTQLIHFIADTRLAKLLGPAEHSHYHTTLWPDARTYIEDHLSRQGF